MRLFDSNILIDHLKKISAATEVLEREATIYISVVTWIEVMAGALPHESQSIRFMLSNCVVLPLTDAIAKQAAASVALPG